ncbi:hypothetical protein [Photobacterium kishitanii]|uniref:Uncharacterized protein n=1 Tax=Photobacterium kishitanii TaxID=318456 RepID=A0A2T3KKU1_9GAMM|nr:hypothetical protein [Photobacterium kishitanii]PSV00311.1 hypothetical protein C9J27_04085 [Photobacterium kishitanii]
MTYTGTIHHINRPEINRHENPSLFASCVEMEVGKIESLNKGDQVNFSNGELVGFVGETLAEFGLPFPEKGCIDIIKSTKPTLIVHKRPTQFGKVEGRRVHRAYSSRKMIDINGHYAEQVLIEYLGSPAWINVCHDEVITHQP